MSGELAGRARDAGADQHVKGKGILVLVTLLSLTSTHFPSFLHSLTLNRQP